MEAWKPIPGFEDCGFISNLGNVKSRFGKHRKMSVGNSGYLRIGFYGGRNTVLVHRLVALAFVDGADETKQVNHKDGVKTNNAAVNLEWTTVRENMLHAYENGLCANFRNRVLTTDQYRIAYAKRTAGATFKQLSEEFGVAASALCKKFKRFERIEGVVN